MQYRFFKFMHKGTEPTILNIDQIVYTEPAKPEVLKGCYNVHMTDGRMHVLEEKDFNRLETILLSKGNLEILD